MRKREDKDRVLREIAVRKPLVVVGSPPCQLFSTLQRFRKDKSSAKYQDAYREAVGYVNFCTEVYELQSKAGRFYLHEHPDQAESWQLERVLALGKQEGVFRVRADQCMYNLKVTDGIETGLARKPTAFLTNSAELAWRLQRRCQRAHGHISLKGGTKASQSQQYPDELVEEMLKGIQAEARNRGLGVRLVGEAIGDLGNIEYEQKFGGEDEKEDTNWQECWDEITGYELDAKKVKEARRE